MTVKGEKFIFLQNRSFTLFYFYEKCLFHFREKPHNLMKTILNLILPGIYKDTSLVLLYNCR